ncbi:UDP-glycosyltransferase 89B2-like [Papaver somniferum]|nr:UDP-glycosyltransferase 89B2-like [Papaver somniferum]
MACWGMVFNSFHELEGIYLDHMKQTYFGNKYLWAVGPISQSGPTERGGANSEESGDIFSWLDTCDDHSVVYVCFGSQAVLDNRQMEALAVGLGKSGVRFLWCVKEPTVGHASGKYGMVPSWFEDRTAGRGLVVRGWAPQVQILQHKAIGSFLTHCSWNSVSESIGAGVPMLAWPMGADQFMNATLLVDQVKVAVQVCEGAKKIPNADELAQRMAESVATGGSTCRNEMRMKAMELKQAATDAVSEENGGESSSKDLDDLVQRLLSNQ